MEEDQMEDIPNEEVVELGKSELILQFIFLFTSL